MEKATIIVPSTPHIALGRLNADDDEDNDPQRPRLETPAAELFLEHASIDDSTDAAAASIVEPAPSVGKLDITWGRRDDDAAREPRRSDVKVGRLTGREWEMAHSAAERDDAAKPATRSGKKWSAPLPPREEQKAPRKAPVSASPVVSVSSSSSSSSSSPLSAEAVDATPVPDEVVSMSLPESATSATGSIALRDEYLLETSRNRGDVVVSLDSATVVDSFPGEYAHPEGPLSTPRGKLSLTMTKVLNESATVSMLLRSDITWGGSLADEPSKPRILLDSPVSFAAEDEDTCHNTSKELSPNNAETGGRLRDASTTVESPSSITSFLSTRPVGRVDVAWPVRQEEYEEQGNIDAALIGKLEGNEWAPSSAVHDDELSDVLLNSSGTGSEAVALGTSTNAKHISALLGIVSRSKNKFDSRPSEPSEVQVARRPSRPSVALLRNMSTQCSELGTSKSDDIHSAPKRADDGASHLQVVAPEMHAVVGLVTKVVSIFEKDPSADNGGGSPGDRTVRERPVTLRPGGSRRARIDAALALAASRTRLRRANKGHDRLQEGGPRKSRKDIELLQSLFRGEAGAPGTTHLDMGAFARAMNDPSVADLIKRVVKETEARSLDSFSAGGLDRHPHNNTAPRKGANPLSMESLFDPSTIRHAAAVTLQVNMFI